MFITDSEESTQSEVTLEVWHSPTRLSCRFSVDTCLYRFSYNFSLMTYPGISWVARVRVFNDRTYTLRSVTYCMYKRNYFANKSIFKIKCIISFTTVEKYPDGRKMWKKKSPGRSTRKMSHNIRKYYFVPFDNSILTITM